MIPQGLVVKAAPVVCVFGGLEAVRAGAEWFVLAGAVCVTLGIFARGFRRTWRSGCEMVKRAHRAFDEIDTFAEFKATDAAFKDSVLERLSAGDERFARIDKSLGVIADTEQLRITDAIARGDQRSPVDRRDAA